MDIYNIPNPVSQTSNEQVTHESLTESNEHDTTTTASALTPAPTRARSNSVLQWMQKTLSHAKETLKHPDDSDRRKRSSSIEHHHSSRHHGDTNSKERPRPISYHHHSHTRPRTQSMSSTQKKIISDTDEQAQQRPSIFQFLI
ncbi:unnamed protein product [Rotaria socialis]|uniref:Uncharacterized protein n=1 Tax=Rotaria socialis TaxID=392032 RepID=A0A820UTM4_9BILA|nr:unnamed protein product [Rotaria socialis]CAF3319391.1 unnamed protein product [Rotaria socialis]CAF3429789.1 unnamed protein product [Rotaria socialis]CAF3463352.1 unnamed protein product [Rotaria socialis]CAF4098559.1 unnamed protein product [Rotaria socialis]